MSGTNVKNPYVTIYVPTMPDVSFYRNKLTDKNHSAGSNHIDMINEMFKVSLHLLRKSNLICSINMTEMGPDTDCNSNYIEVRITDPSGILLRQCLVKRSLCDRDLIMEVREINESMKIDEICALIPLAFRLGCKYLLINKKYSTLVAIHSSGDFF